VIMEQPASAAAIDAIEFAQSRWSPRRRTIFIISTVVGLWALPICLVYGLSRIFL
jgi:hypothetical protein